MTPARRRELEAAGFARLEPGTEPPCTTAPRREDGPQVVYQPYSNAPRGPSAEERVAAAQAARAAIEAREVRAVAAVAHIPAPEPIPLLQIVPKRRRRKKIPAPPVETRSAKPRLCRRPRCVRMAEYLGPGRGYAEDCEACAALTRSFEVGHKKPRT